MKSILIVEDEMLIASVLKKYIENAGYHCVGIATDYNDALSLMKQNNVDFVFLDIRISGKKTGLDIAYYINLTHPLPFIFLTSHSDKNTLAEVTKTKPVGYLSKPFKAIDVTTALNLYFNNENESNTAFKLSIGKNIHYVDLKNIQYAEANHVYVDIVFENETLMLRTSLSNLLKRLPKGTLNRVNRSVAIHPKAIRAISNNKVMVKNKAFKLSSKYAEHYKNLL